MSKLPSVEPTKAKVPQGVMATLLTSPPSPVSNAQRPAFFRPQNHVLAYLSPLWPVTTLSHPVSPLAVASVALLGEEALHFVHIAPDPAAAPIPPSRFNDEAIHVISGALRSSRVVLGSIELIPNPRIPIFFAFLRMFPWLSSVLWPSLRRLQAHKLRS